MQKFNLIEHYRDLSAHLAAQYRLSSAYGHSGSKGQLRENFLTETLQAIAHDYTKLCKGEICDSSGRRSAEFDIIVSYWTDAIRLFGSTINQVIPVEAVLSVIEVKSILKEEHIINFNSDLKNLNSFDRYYVPTSAYKYIGEITGNKEYTSFLGRPIKPLGNVRGVTQIVGGIFAFEAPSLQTFQKWLQNLPTEPNFGFIVVLGRIVAARSFESGQWEVKEPGLDAFSAFASVFSTILTDSNDREAHLKADSSRYVQLAAEALEKQLSS